MVVQKFSNLFKYRDTLKICFLWRPFPTNRRKLSFTLICNSFKVCYTISNVSYDVVGHFYTSLSRNFKYSCFTIYRLMSPTGPLCLIKCQKSSKLQK